MNDVLIVIPVRGGSVGVPRKCIRPLGNKSCLQRVIETAQQIADADVLVTTDDEAMSQLANSWGSNSVIEQGRPLGAQPLDRSVDLATWYAERGGRKPYAIVMTMQANCPFTKPETVRHAIAMARQHETAIVVRDDRGLRWHTKAQQPVLSASAPPRMVRQQMPPEWREVGAVLATQRRFVTPTSRMGYTVYLIPVTGAEALDIDTEADWLLAECYAARGDLVGVS